MLNKCRVYKTKIVNVAKRHECAKCGCKIKKGDKATNITYSYDNRLISLYMCSECEIIKGGEKYKALEWWGNLSSKERAGIVGTSYNLFNSYTLETQLKIIMKLWQH